MDTITILLNSLKESDDSVRRNAAEQLQSCPTDTVISALVSTLGDINRGVAEAAENSLLAIRGGVVVKKLIPLLSSEQPKVRNFAFEMLCEIGMDSINDVIALLKSIDKDIRKYGTDILGELKSPLSMQGLISALEDTEINVAAAAAESLGKIKDASAIPELVKKLNSDLWMQCSVIKSLSMFNDKRASAELYKMLPQLKGIALFSAISALKDMGDKEAIPTLITLLNQKNKALEGSIVTALEKIIQREKERETPFEINTIAIDVNELLKLLADPQIQTKISAINILGWLKKEESVKPLINELIATEKNIIIAQYKEDLKHSIFNAITNIKPKNISTIISAIESMEVSDDVKAELIDIIGKIKAVSALDSLLMLKNSSSKILRRVLARTLGEFNHPAAIEVLKSLLKDSEGHTRGNSAESLGKLKAESAVDNLIALFNDEYKNIREDAATALAKIETPSVINKLKDILSNSPDSEKKRLAILALRKMEGTASVKILVEHLQDNDPQIRKITVEAIDEKNVNTLYDKLIPMIDDTSYEVKIAVLKTLSKGDSKVVTPHLIKALKDERNIRIKYHFIETIGNLRAAEAVPIIIEQLNDQSSLVVLSAIEALGKIKDKQSIQPLKKLCENKDKEIAITAKEALSKIEGR